MMMMTMTMIDGGDVSIFVARNNSSSDVLTLFQTDMSLVSWQRQDIFIVVDHYH